MINFLVNFLAVSSIRAHMLTVIYGVIYLLIFIY